MSRSMLLYPTYRVFKRYCRFLVDNHFKATKCCRIKFQWVEGIYYVFDVKHLNKGLKTSNGWPK